jgi:hypothetical protein
MKTEQAIQVQEHLSKLGRIATDCVTGFSGVVASISFDLYGCIQVVVTPRVGADGKIPDSQWFDISRLRIESENSVMPLPNYEYGPVARGEHGPAAKSIPPGI